VKGQGKLNMHIISKSVLMLWTENYQNQSMLVKTTACQSWRVFLRHSVKLMSDNFIYRVEACQANSSVRQSLEFTKNYHE